MFQNIPTLATLIQTKTSFNMITFEGVIQNEVFATIGHSIASEFINARIEGNPFSDSERKMYLQIYESCFRDARRAIISKHQHLLPDNILNCKMYRDFINKQN